MLWWKTQGKLKKSYPSFGFQKYIYLRIILFKSRQFHKILNHCIISAKIHKEKLLIKCISIVLVHLNVCYLSWLVSIALCCVFSAFDCPIKFLSLFFWNPSKQTISQTSTNYVIASPPSSSPLKFAHTQIWRENVFRVQLIISCNND